MSTKKLKLLAIETATEACSVALSIDGEVRELYQVAPRQHAQYILAMIEKILAQADLTLQQMDGLAFSRGPGSFTGVRLATSVIQGLAFGLDVPVVPVSTLQALAQSAYRQFQASNVLAALDARMQQIYWAKFALSSKKLMVPTSAEAVSAPEDVVLTSTDACVGIGSGCDQYQQLLQTQLSNRIQAWYAQQHPHAEDVAQLACAAWQSGDFVSAEQAVPVYLRDQVVKNAR